MLLNAPNWSGGAWGGRLTAGGGRGGGGERACPNLACALVRSPPRTLAPTPPPTHTHTPTRPPTRWAVVMHAVIWRLISGAIPRKTREGLMLFTRGEGDAARKALLELVPPDQLPAEYGGTSTTPLPQTTLELEMLAYVRSLADPAATAGQGG